MKDPIITYRGAKAKLSELQPRVDQLQQQQGTRQVAYRGVTGNATFGPHEKKVRKVTYRGVTAEMEV